MYRNIRKKRKEIKKNTFIFLCLYFFPSFLSFWWTRGQKGKGTNGQNGRMNKMAEDKVLWNRGSKSDDQY